MIATGIFGITIAQRNPAAAITAVDWAPVHAVAAFTVDYGSCYDVALMTNFLHHFDPPTNVTLLKKTAAALKPGGRIAVLEMVPNEDRVSPPLAAGFALTMLAGTPAGDAFTLKDLTAMLTDAGFGGVSIHPTPGPGSVVLASRLG